MELKSAVQIWNQFGIRSSTVVYLFAFFLSLRLHTLYLWIEPDFFCFRRSMSFGWHRAEVIGATVSVLMIWVVTGVLVRDHPLMTSRK